MTTAVQLFAEKIDEEVARASRRGVLAAQRASSVLRMKVARAAQRGEIFETRPILVDFLLPILTDGMIVSHLMGERRAMLMQRHEEPSLKLGFFDTVLKVLKRRTRLDVNKLQEKYQTQALRILNTVSKKVDAKLRDVVTGLIGEGTSTRAGIKALQTAFDNLGISPKSSFQIETIFRTQTQLSYGAGRWEYDQQPDVQEILWGYKYVTVGDDRVRPAHEELEGVTLPKDDDFWQTFWPPNGWNCRCQAIPIFEERDIVEPPERTPDGDPVQPDEGFRFNAGEVFGDNEVEEPAEFGFDPNQPRDKDGQWGSGPGSGKGVAAKGVSTKSVGVNKSDPVSKKSFLGNSDSEKISVIQSKMSGKLTPSQMAKIVAINDGTDNSVLLVPKALSKDQLKQVEEAFPQMQVKQVNALKLMQEKVGGGETAAKMGMKPKKEKTKEEKMATPAPPPKSTFTEKGDGIEILTKTEKPELYEGFKEKQKLFNNRINNPSHPSDREISEAISLWKDSSTDVKHEENTKPPPPYSDTTVGFHKMLKAAPEYKGITYRGMSDLDAPTLAKFTDVGAVIEMRSSSSSSRSNIKAAGFGTQILMRIKSKTSAWIEDIGDFRQEKEVVLKKGTKYRITGVSKDVKLRDNKVSNVIIRHLVDMEEI